MGKFFQHTENCLRYGESNDCPACRFIESKERESEREELKERQRYRRLIPGRKLR
jgi:hypothetical protein